MNRIIRLEEPPEPRRVQFSFYLDNIPNHRFLYILVFSMVETFLKMFGTAISKGSTYQYADGVEHNIYCTMQPEHVKLVDKFLESIGALINEAGFSMGHGYRYMEGDCIPQTLNEKDD